MICMKRREIIEEWVKLFNKGNADAISELYHEDAINHQVANKPIEGKTSIKEMFSSEFAAADMTAGRGNCTFVDGHVAPVRRDDSFGAAWPK